MKQVAKGLQMGGNFGTAHVYRSSLNAIIAYRGKGDFTFNEVTPEWIKGFESLNRQSEQEAQRQISEISSRFTALLEDCENVCREQTKDGSVARYMIDTTTVEMQRGMYVSLYQASKEIYGHAQISVYDVGGRLRFTTDTMTRGDRLPVYWGLLKKASGKKQMTWYRTDPYLNLTDSRVLMQGAYPIENSGGARTGYLVLDFTRENFDSIFS